MNFADNQNSCASSFAQERLWFLDQLEPGNPFYNVPVAMRLRGTLDTSALGRSLNALRERHASLRTTLPAPEGKPVQCIAPFEPQALALEDLSSLDAAQREPRALELASAEAQRPFDLVQGPLFRARLLRLAPDDHVFVLTCHHCIIDGWSLGLLFRELAAAYSAFRRGQVPSFLPLPLQYADFAHWQRAWLQGPVREAQLAYWRERLAAPLPVLAMPTDRPRPPVQRFRGARLPLALPAHLIGALRELSRQHGCTLFMTLLAAFTALLHRYTGQHDILVGTAISQRPTTETESVIGLFLNTLAIRTEIDPAQPFTSHLVKVRTRCLEAYANQDLPFEALVEAIQPPRDMSRHPIVQAMLVDAPAGSTSLELDDIECTAVDIQVQGSKFDLTLTINHEVHGIMVTADYSAALFDSGTVERFLRHFRTLLECAVAAPERVLATIPLLAPGELRELLDLGSGPAAALPVQTIPDLFEAQAAQIPDAIALRGPDENEPGVKYGFLNERANRLAHHLRTCGVGPEVLVGVCAERSPELIVAILAVMKAGGAYLPLDPAHPAGYLLELTRKAQLHHLICRPDSPLAAASGIERVYRLGLEPDDDATGESTRNPQRRLHPDNLAYAIFTSGSTGEPKAVLATQRATLNRLLWATDELPLARSDTCCLKTAVGFIDSFFEIIAPLISGARSIILPPPVSSSPARLLEALSGASVSRLIAVPSLLRAILDEPASSSDSRPSLRTIISSGEALPPALAARVLDAFPGCRLLNLYGASEVSADVTCHEVRRESPDNCIGKSISNTSIYVLDGWLQPVPPGVVGEIYVGGVGLARGYLQAPGLSAARFFPDPFSAVPGGRMFRSGDLGRIAGDGRIEFVGRADHQLKVLGSRIEPLQIENMLCGHPRIGSAAVCQGGSHTSSYLSCYVEPRPGASESAAPPVRFSLMFFGVDSTISQPGKYALYLDAARFADANGFEAVWVPERHFHEVGGLFPNPAVVCAALASITQRVHLRAGSVVLPLHHLGRVAEEWSVVDNLSSGRVGLAVVSGWVAGDYLYFPERYERRRELLLSGIAELQSAWKGAAVSTTDGSGRTASARLFPRPIQADLPLWLTCTRDPSMFEEAGRRGLNVLTALIGQTHDQLALNIARYRRVLASCGHRQDSFRVTVMLHTFVSQGDGELGDAVRQALRGYLGQHFSLVQLAGGGRESEDAVASKREHDDVADFAHERYIRNALVGSHRHCESIVQSLAAIGVDEVACLIDFGLPREDILLGLERLAAVARSCTRTEPLTSRSIRAYLRERLPAHLIPSRIEVVERLPRLPNGKIDHSGLDRSTTVPLEGPRVASDLHTSTEIELGTIWKKLLGVQSICRDDDFFQLGGHSLLAARMMSLIRARFRIEMQVSAIFGYPTLAELAEAIDIATIEQADTPVVLDALKQLGLDTGVRGRDRKP